MRRFLRLALAAACLAAVVVPTSPAGRNDVAARLSRALAVRHAGLTAAVAVDLDTGNTLFHRRQRLALAPASNEKLAVTYTALAVLGPSFRIDTTVFGDGQLIDGAWHGDLVLKGYGDPTLSRRDLEKLASQLRDGGLRRVTGHVLGDESFFDSLRVGPLWKPGFYINESPPLSALTVDRDAVRGFAAANPPLVAAQEFRKLLVKDGIRIDGRAATGVANGEAFPLATVRSAPMSVLVGWMNRESDNFMAELLLKQLGTVDGGQGTSARGGAVVRKTLASVGVPLQGVRMVDGSGLSPYDRLTADALVGILEAAWRDPAIRIPFVASLPVAGEAGTLADRLRTPPARGNVIAKTGTTDGASTLAGYVRRKFAFAVLNNGRPVNTDMARRAQDRFAAVLAAQ